MYNVKIKLLNAASGEVIENKFSNAFIGEHVLDK